MHAEIAHDAVFELRRERLIEREVLFPVLILEAGEFCLDLLLQVLGDDLQLAVMLQQLAGDIQAEIRGIHHAAYEAEMLRHKIGALVHDHHAGGIKLQARLIIPGVIVIRRFRGDKQLVSPSAFTRMTPTGSAVSWKCSL